jgi:PqqD family protein of HPr-rel-A system
VNDGPIWRLRPGQTLQYRQWDGECVLYNDLSGDTHLLGEAAVEILLALRRTPATRVALATMLEAEFDIDPVELGPETEHLLQHLERLHLVESAAC